MFRDLGHNAHVDQVRIDTALLEFYASVACRSVRRYQDLEWKHE